MKIFNPKIHIYATIFIILALLILSYYMHIILLGMGILAMLTVASIVKNYHSLTFEHVVVDRMMLYCIALMCFACFQTFQYWENLNDNYAFVYGIDLKSEITDKIQYKVAIGLELSNSKPITFTAPGISWFHRNNVVGDSLFKAANSDTIIIKHQDDILTFKITYPGRPF